MRVRAGIVVTGTEVLSGKVSDRNGPWVSERLFELGIDLAHITVCGDRPEDMEAQLRFLADQGVQLIVTTGGLGPTADDLTREALAAATSRRLERDASIVAGLRARFARYARPMSDTNLQQADVIEGGVALIELEPTTDILAELGALKGSRIVVGFAAETTDVLANARKKLESKSLDAIVLNDVSQPGIGFDSERNAVTIITHAGADTVPETSKWEVAHRVLDAVVKLKAERKTPSVRR